MSNLKPVTEEDIRTLQNTLTTHVDTRVAEEAILFTTKINNNAVYQEQQINDQIGSKFIIQEATLEESIISKFENNRIVTILKSSIKNIVNESFEALQNTQTQLYDGFMDVTNAIATKLQKYGEVMSGRSDIESATVIKQHYDLLENTRSKKPEVFTELLLSAQKYSKLSPNQQVTFLKTTFVPLVASLPPVALSSLASGSGDTNGDSDKGGGAAGDA